MCWERSRAVEVPGGKVPWLPLIFGRNGLDNSSSSEAQGTSDVGGWNHLSALGQRLTFGLTCVGLALMAAAALAPHVRSYIAAIGIGLLILVSAFGVGSSLGFIFALPRAVPPTSRTNHNPSPATGNSPAVGTHASPPGDADARPSRRYLESNGSLERISDWLSAMIVGIGLTQLHNIDDALSRFRDFISTYAAIFPQPNGHWSAGVLPVIAPLLLITGGIAGTLFMYLYTRLLLSPLFNETEQLLDGGTPLSNAVAAKVEAASAPDQQTKAQIVLKRTSPGSRNELSLEDAVGRMFAALYKPPPRGFTETIEIAAALAGTTALARADYWYYLAAAFGQQHKYQKLQHAKKEILTLSRDNALDAAQRAVTLDPAYRARLRLLLSADSSDDDLSDFAEDPSFRKIISPGRT